MPPARRCARARYRARRRWQQRRGHAELFALNNAGPAGQAGTLINFGAANGTGTGQSGSTYNVASGATLGCPAAPRHWPPDRRLPALVRPRRAVPRSTSMVRRPLTGPVTLSSGALTPGGDQQLQCLRTDDFRRHADGQQRGAAPAPHPVGRTLAGTGLLTLNGAGT